MTTRVAYIGRDLFAPALDAIATHATVVAVHTSFGPGETLSGRIHEIADRRGLPIHVGAVGPQALRQCADAGVDYVVCGGWPKVLPDPADFGLRGLNIHPSLLPEGRGPWPLPRVILDGHRRTGVTLHHLTAELDAGPIVLREAFAVAPWFDLDTLVHRCRTIAARLVSRFLADPEALWSAAQPQGPGSWWPRPTRAERTLDWSRPAEHLMRQARAFGRLGVEGGIDGRLHRLTGVDVCDASAKPGAILSRTGDEAIIAAGVGALQVRIGPPVS